MIGSATVSPHNSPSSAIPHFGKVRNDSHPSPINNLWRVFHKHEPGSYLANDSGHFSPQSGAFAVFNSFSSAGNADVLAGKPARNHVNNSAPGLSVECSRVIPNGERLKASVILSRHEDVSWVLGIFNGADGSPSEQFAAENSPTSARE
jgi:hypothetical protein